MNESTLNKTERSDVRLATGERDHRPARSRHERCPGPDGCNQDDRSVGVGARIAEDTGCEATFCAETREGSKCTTLETGKVLCICPYGFTDPDCAKEDSPCESLPCYNDGECVENCSFGYKCPLAFDGEFCEVMIIHTSASDKISEEFSTKITVDPTTADKVLPEARFLDEDNNPSLDCSRKPCQN